MSLAKKRERPFLSAEWRDLAMLNYSVSPDLLRPLLPLGTELDEWEGVTYMSVVGFRFLSTRVLGFGVPWHRDFEEVNLRFYVRRLADGVWRRGVVFIRELVPRRVIAWMARTWYNEPYIALPMRHAITRGVDGSLSQVRYEWRSRAEWDGLSVQARGVATPLTSGSEAEFITEHFWGYTRQRDGSTLEYQVAHPAWRVYDVRGAELRCDVASLYGSRFVAALRGEPRSAFVAEGSAVIVYRPTALDP